MKRIGSLFIIILNLSVILPSTSHAKSARIYGIKSSASSKISLNLSSKLTIKSSTEILNTNLSGNKVQEHSFCIEKNNNSNYKIFTNHNQKDLLSLEWKDSNTTTKLVQNQQSVVNINQDNCENNNSTNAKLRVISNDNSNSTNQKITQPIILSFSPV